jgi:phospholipase C
MQIPIPSGAALPDPNSPAGTHRIPEIDHVVILMMSGHSYDNYFGMLDKGGAGFPLSSDGRPDESQPSADGTRVRLFHEATTRQAMPPRLGGASWTASHMQWDMGKSDGFVRAVQYLSPGMDQRWPMRYWAETDLPFYYRLAQTFPLASRWFSSCLAPSAPNRRFLVSGTAYGSIGDYRVENGRRPPAGTIFDHLDRSAISWANYFFDSAVQMAIPVPPGTRLIAQRIILLARLLGGLDRITDLLTSRLPRTVRRLLGTVTCTAGVYRLGLLRRWRHLAEIDQFFVQAKEGTLPSVCIVDPDFVANSGAAPQDVGRSEQFAAQVVNAVMNSPCWARTLLIWLHDHHGGYYDHVPPPLIVDDGVPPRKIFSPLGGRVARRQLVDAGPNDYKSLGFRVPAVIVSPYAKPDYVSEAYYDHCSVLKAIESIWNLPALTARDAAAANPLEDMLDFGSSPAFVDPPALAAATPWIPVNPFRVQDFPAFVRSCLTVAVGWAVGFWAFTSRTEWIQVAVVAVLVLLTARLIGVTRFWRKWVFWRTYDDELSVSAAIYSTVVALLSLTALFAIVSALMYEWGAFKAAPSAGNEALWRYTLSYIWNAADAIPALRLTQTFAWNPDIIFLDPWSRGLLILYRLLALAPVVQLVVSLLQPKRPS